MCGIPAEYLLASAEPVVTSSAASTIVQFDASWNLITLRHSVYAALSSAGGCSSRTATSQLGSGAAQIDAVDHVGLDSSLAQLTACPFRPVVRGEMTALPFRDASFAEVTHLWCLYHLEDPSVAVAEAKRVLRPGGRYYACTAARDNDPEIMPEGYPPTSFDAEEAVSVVTSVFEHVEAQRWDGKFFPLATRDEVRAYCRHNFIPPGRAEHAEVPLWLTKRGVLVRARKP